LALRADLDLALDQADDLAVGRRLAPQVGAADAGRDRGDLDAHVAPAVLGRDVGREAERALQHAERRAEQTLRRLELLQLQLAVLAELDGAALGELHLQARARAGDQLVAGPELHAR